MTALKNLNKKELIEVIEDLNKTSVNHEAKIAGLRKELADVAGERNQLREELTTVTDERDTWKEKCEDGWESFNQQVAKTQDLERGIVKFIRTAGGHNEQ